MHIDFNDEEIKALKFGYRVEDYIKSIIRLRKKGLDQKNNPFYDRWIKDIDLVYNTYQKALKLCPNDEKTEEWKMMIKRIEDIV